MQSWIGGVNFVNPHALGKKALLIGSWDGNGNWKLYDSNVGYWQTVVATGGGTSSFRFWLGAAYNTELPIALEHFIAMVGDTPADAEMNSLIANQYQIYKPKTYIISDAAPTPPAGIEVFRRRMIMKKAA